MRAAHPLVHRPVLPLALAAAIDLQAARAPLKAVPPRFVDGSVIFDELPEAAGTAFMQCARDFGDLNSAPDGVAPASHPQPSIWPVHDFPFANCGRIGGQAPRLGIWGHEQREATWHEGGDVDVEANSASSVAPAAVCHVSVTALAVPPGNGAQGRPPHDGQHRRAARQAAGAGAGVGAGAGHGADAGAGWPGAGAANLKQNGDGSRSMYTWECVYLGVWQSS